MRIQAEPQHAPHPWRLVMERAGARLGVSRWSDYLALTKPWIVALLLTTTLAAMLIAARGVPPLPVLMFTLLGGACAAGGGNALNSYIDRETDRLMGRTARRPLPSGRIPPRR